MHDPDIPEGEFSYSHEKPNTFQSYRSRPEDLLLEAFTKKSRLLGRDGGLSQVSGKHPHYFFFFGYIVAHQGSSTLISMVIGSFKGFALQNQ